eukprot:5407183-Pyramimonas_sp.AAC.1
MQSSDKPVFAFGSRLPRFQEKKSITPGPGEYDVNDCIGFEAWVKKQPSAGFLDHRERFIKECLGFADGELVPRCGDTLRRTLAYETYRDVSKPLFQRGAHIAGRIYNAEYSYVLPHAGVGLVAPPGDESGKENAKPVANRKSMGPPGTNRSFNWTTKRMHELQVCMSAAASLRTRYTSTHSHSYVATTSQPLSHLR